MSYDGGQIGGWRPLHVYAGTTPVWFAYNIGTNLPLPAGTWTCTFTLGSVHVSVPFTTNGPTGEVVDFTTCADSNTIGSYKNGICRTDQGSAGLPSTGVIICSLDITNRIGSTPKIDFLDPTGAVLFSHTGHTITKTLWPLWAWTSAPGPSPSFAPGTYACRVSIDGNDVITRSFAVAG
jgi:hypothetical protein